MNRYLGIGKEVSDKWYTVNLLLINTMIKIYLYTPKIKRPYISYYNKEQFDYCINETKIINLKWFIGIIYKK